MSRPSAPYPIVNGTHSGYPVYTGPGYADHTSKGGNGNGYAVHTSKAGHGNGYSAGKPSVTSKPVYAASSSAPAKTTCITTTYVDVCETGLTTKTATITKTYSDVAPKPTPNEVPEGWYTTVTVCSHCGPKTTTVTLTKPYATPTEAAYHAPSPSSPAAEHSGSKGEYPAAKPSEAAYVPGKPGKPAGQETVSVTKKVYITVVPAPAPTSALPGYGAAPSPAPHVPANSTLAYVPSGTASSTGHGAAGYTGMPVPSKIPALYEGAASRFSVGVSGLAVLVAGILMI